MSFFEYTNLKIKITRVWGRTYSSPVYQSDIPRVVAFSSSIPVYEMIFFPPSDHILHYNGITTHITNSSLVFLPHCMTDVVNPPIKEYRNETFLDAGHIAFQFTCDTPLAEKIEVYSCADFEKDIEVHFDRLHRLWELQPTAYQSLALACLYQIFATVETRTSTSYLSKEQYTLIEKSLDYINDNYLTAMIDCDELAKMCRISPSYYNRLFKKKFNMSPKQYILKKKLNYAIDLLTNTDLPITSVAKMSGFSSLYYFSKVFKNHYDISPQNYRDNHNWGL